MIESALLDEAGIFARVGVPQRLSDRAFRTIGLGNVLSSALNF